jgi:hypothetical protein
MAKYAGRESIALLAEIRALFSNQLDPARADELRDRILAAGLPI